MTKKRGRTHGQEQQRRDCGGGQGGSVEVEEDIGGINSGGGKKLGKKKGNFLLHTLLGFLPLFRAGGTGLQHYKVFSSQKQHSAAIPWGGCAI